LFEKTREQFDTIKALQKSAVAVRALTQNVRGLNLAMERILQNKEAVEQLQQTLLRYEQLALERRERQKNIG